jgi:uracil-DNA glycosylase family 4
MLNEIGWEVRHCNKCESVTNIPQPGYFAGKILFVFQNPGSPQHGKPQDEILKDRELPMDHVNDIYRSTLQHALLGSFIELLGLRWDEISITNLIKCPTPGNIPPTDTMIENCASYLERQIDILKPKLVVLNGALPQKVMLSKLKGRYNVIGFKHYSYLSRNGILQKYAEEYKLMLQNTLKEGELQQTLFNINGDVND